MANDLNKVILIGRMVRDPELRQTQSGTPYCRFSIAVNRSFTQNGEKREDVSFIDCVAWQRLSEIINQYARKGKQLCVEGRLNQRSWKDDAGNNRSTMDVVVENMQLLGGRSDDSGSSFGGGGDSYSGGFSGQGGGYPGQGNQGYGQPSRQGGGSYGQPMTGQGQKMEQGGSDVYTDDFADDDIPF